MTEIQFRMLRLVVNTLQEELAPPEMIGRVVESVLADDKATRLTRLASRIDDESAQVRGQLLANVVPGHVSTHVKARPIVRSRQMDREPVRPVPTECRSCGMIDCVCGKQDF